MAGPDAFEQLLDDLTTDPTTDGVARLVSHLLANQPDASQTLRVHELLHSKTGRPWPPPHPTKRSKSGTRRRPESRPLWKATRVGSSRADAVTLSGRDVSDQLFERLRGFFDDDAIVELTAVVAWENASSKFNRALRIESQGLWKTGR